MGLEHPVIVRSESCNLLTAVKITQPAKGKQESCAAYLRICFMILSYSLAADGLFVLIFNADFLFTALFCMSVETNRLIFWLTEPEKGLQVDLLYLELLTVFRSSFCCRVVICHACLCMCVSVRAN